MRKIFIKMVDKMVSSKLKTNVNSTTSLAIFQPQMPAELKALSKIK